MSNRCRRKAGSVSPTLEITAHMPGVKVFSLVSEKSVLSLCSLIIGLFQYSIFGIIQVLFYCILFL